LNLRYLNSKHFGVENKESVMKHTTAEQTGPRIKDAAVMQQMLGYFDRLTPCRNSFILRF
jgi:hypothetical protein